MGEAREKLTTGNFNHMHQEYQPDGTLKITLTKRGDPKKYVLVVRNPHKPDEQIISDETIL